MAGRIPQPFIDEVVSRSDIVEVIGARVPLKKSGREYKACCPFHTEKSPSFWVSPDKQFYHCFGCGAHGTVVGFLMQYEKLGFLDAVADLAERAGLELPREAQSAREPAGGDRPSFQAVEERVAWWAEVFEAPCVAYAGSIEEVAPLVQAGADFIALGDWLWRDPQEIAATVARAAESLRLPESAA